MSGRFPYLDDEDGDDLVVRPRRTGLRRAATLTGVAVVVAVLVIGGSRLPTQRAADPPVDLPAVGRITTICSQVSAADGSGVPDTPQPSGAVSSAVVPPPSGSASAPTTAAPSVPGPSGASPSTSVVPSGPVPSGPVPSTPVPSGQLPPSTSGSSTPGSTSPGPTSSATVVPEPPVETEDPVTTTVTAVTVRGSVDRAGSLTARPLNDLSGAEPPLQVTRPGFGEQLDGPTGSLLIEADGGLAGSSSAALLSVAESGEQAGLLGAPCRPPGVSHWFVGVGGGQDYRSDLVLSNPDDAQAEVDLRFYGSTGRIVVPGAPGLVVAAHSVRTVSLAPLINADGPLSVWVRATEGRVAAMARDLTSANLTPTGADWHPASVSPDTDLVVPGLPEGEGSRQLVVTNAGSERATVAVSVLAVQGSYTPAGAESLSIEPETTATVDLTAGLDGQVGAVQLSADQPVAAAVRVVTAGTDTAGAPLQPDLAVLPATAAVGRTGVSAIATTGGADSELLLSNGTDEDAPVTFDVYSLEGVSLRRDEVFVAARSTSTRRLTSTAPSYVVVRAPAGPDVYGTVSLTQPSGPIAGITSIPLTAPDFSGRAPSAVPDARVGR